MLQNPTPTTAGRSYSTPTRRDFGYYDHNFELLDVDKAARSHGTQTLTRDAPPAPLIPPTDMHSGEVTPATPSAATQALNSQPVGPPCQSEFTFWDGSVIKGRILSFDGKTYVIALNLGQISLPADKFARVKTLPLAVPGLTNKQRVGGLLVRRMAATVPVKMAVSARPIPARSALAKAAHVGTTYRHR